MEHPERIKTELRPFSAWQWIGWLAVDALAVALGFAAAWWVLR